jgi:mono/diheme cytochrome c family protein
MQVDFGKREYDSNCASCHALTEYIFRLQAK